MSGQQQGSQKPLGRRPCRRQIIGVDQQRVGADLIRHEGDGIGLGDKHLAPDTNRRRIQPYPCASHDARIAALGKTCEEVTEQIYRNFPDRQC